MTGDSARPGLMRLGRGRPGVGVESPALRVHQALVIAALTSHAAVAALTSLLPTAVLVRSTVAEGALVRDG